MSSLLKSTSSSAVVDAGGSARGGSPFAVPAGSPVHRPELNELKIRSSEKVDIILTEMSSMNAHILRVSRTSELLSQTAKTFASLDSSIENANSNISKSVSLTSGLQQQTELLAKRIAECVPSVVSHHSALDP